jgi:hypothetical protein
MRTKGIGTLSSRILSKKQIENPTDVNLLTIKDYGKDIDVGVFWGWDMKTAVEHDAFYSFEFHNRADSKYVYVLLHRQSMVFDNNQIQYECYIADMNDKWKTKYYFPTDRLVKDKFYESIEQIIEHMYINL